MPKFDELTATGTTPGRFFHTIAVSRMWAVNRTGEIVVPTHGKTGNLIGGKPA